jgi:hypothetical protein
VEAMPVLLVEEDVALLVAEADCVVGASAICMRATRAMAGRGGELVCAKYR